MIYDELIRNAMRVRIVNANIIAATDIQFENKTFTATGKTKWLRETWIAGEERALSNSRSNMTAFMQYDVYVPLNTGTLNAGLTANAIENEFDINNISKRVITVSTVPTLSTTVYRVKTETGSDTSWYWQTVLLYLNIVAN